jgi:hypothetical protein
VPLITEKLTEKGWRTAAFVADPRVGQGSGLGRGFEVFDAPKETLLGSFRHLPMVRNPGDVVANFSLWIADVPEDASFLAWVHLTRPMIDPPAVGAAEDVRPALARLSELVDGSARLKGASVMLVGTAGRIDLDDGESSGYFLSESVLRVPVLVRSSASTSEDGTLDPQSPFSLVDVAQWISREAGIEGTSSGATVPAQPRVAWTWRGQTEFGWPAEIAAQQGSALCVRALPGKDDECVRWQPATAVGEADRNACVAKMTEAAPMAEGSRALPSLPIELTQRVKKLGLKLPAVRVGTAPAVAKELRQRAVPAITRARRLADQQKPIEADAEFQKALAIDPRNVGALIEAGGVLVLQGHPKLAKARLEPAMRAASWSPEVWHWTGHVSYLEKQLDRAEAQWLMSDALEPGNADVLYDLACARSLAGDAGNSLDYLRRAWQAGFRDVNSIQVDADLRNLRADPSYLRFMREVVH